MLCKIVYINIIYLQFIHTYIQSKEFTLLSLLILLQIQIFYAIK